MMVDPIGRSSPLAPDTDYPQEQEDSRRPHVTVSTPQAPESEPAGGGIGAKIGAKLGGENEFGGEAHLEGGGDIFGGAYVDGGAELKVSTPGFKAGSDVSGRYYPGDATGKFSRGEGGFHWEVGRPGTSKGESGRIVWDNNPVTPESSGRNWDQIGGKFVERTGADNLERDGASNGFHGLFFGYENDHRFNPEGLRFERNQHLGTLSYLEQDVLGLVNYDPPSANVYTTTKTGLGLMRVGTYVSDMEKETLDSDWALGPRDAFDRVARERAAASYARLSSAPRSADVLDGLGLGTREAFLGHIEETINSTHLPGSLVVDRMHVAVHQTANAIESNPTISAEQAFAEQPAIDRPALDQLVMDDRLSPVAALDVALARAEGDMRPIQQVINSRGLNGTSIGAGFADDAVTMDAIYGYMSGRHPSFDAVVAAAEARRAGDTRSAGALVVDYHEDGVIDGSNVVNVSFGDETYAVLPGEGEQAVAQPDGTIAPVQTMRPDTARGLLSMIETAREQERAGKVDIARSVVEEAVQHGVSPDDQRALYNQVRISQEAFGDTRNADALVADSRDNGFIDGSNLPEAAIGDQTYAVSTGGGVMHGRTTMTPTEIAARANAHAAHGGDVDADAVAKARADAMAQSLREGFSSRDQIAAGDPAATRPGEAAAAVRRDLEAMVDAENGAALAGQERQALEVMIAEAQRIEEAARFEGAKGLADNEYAVAIQMQERQALDAMITKAQEIDALADVPIPAFKPDLQRSESSNGPDMRGDQVAYGRGVVENGPGGGKTVAYDNLSDWAADMRDGFNGNPSREGVAKPNKAELEQQEADKQEDAAPRDEGGENRGQQNDIPEAGSEEDAAATSAEFDSMGSHAGPDEDTSAKSDDEGSSSSSRNDREGGESRGQQRDSDRDPQRESNDVRDSGSF